MSNKRALVTGATGLLGSNLCRALVAEGWEVLALARSAEKASTVFSDLDVQIVVGDMENVAGFAPVLDGVDVLFHTAAFFREYYSPGDHWDTMKRINVDATMELIREADARGVSRTIHTSSSGVIQTNVGQSADESAAYSDFAEKNLYFKTKVIVEKEISQFLQNARMDVVLILPGWMMGPGDAAPTSAGQLVLDLLARKLPGLIDGGSSLADARDVAAAMVSAATHGRRGERYIVTGPLATMVDIAAGIHKASGVKVPAVTLPNWLALSAARISDGWAKITGGVSSMPYDGVSTLLEKAILSSEKAKRELGATFRPLAETIAETVEWYRTNGYLAE